MYISARLWIARSLPSIIELYHKTSLFYRFWQMLYFMFFWHDFNSFQQYIVTNCWHTSPKVLSYSRWIFKSGTEMPARFTDLWINWSRVPGIMPESAVAFCFSVCFAVRQSFYFALLHSSVSNLPFRPKYFQGENDDETYLWRQRQTQVPCESCFLHSSSCLLS